MGWLIAATGIAAGLIFGLTVGKLSWGAPLVALSLGGMTLGLTGLALWRLLDPLLRPEDALPEPVRAPARLRELEREKQMVLKAIKEVELDFQMRKITEQDHREQTQRYRARAMRILAELDAGDDYRSLIEQELKHRLAAQKAASLATSDRSSVDAAKVEAKKG